MEWMDIFESKKLDIQRLKSEINDLDKDLDHIIYSIYDLSDEEIVIVENS